jgi:hypothetical protein
MKRGFGKVRNQEPSIEPLTKQDNIAQAIGHFAQRGVYEFQQNPTLLSSADGVEKVGKILGLDDRIETVRDKILEILQGYRDRPILSDKNVFLLQRGDEGFPPPITIGSGANKFNLFASFDCIFIEPDGKLHILDFKTGKSLFDKRQAYVYLLAAKFLYPDKRAIASFYNLESQVLSESIELSNMAFESLQIELFNLANKLQQKKRYYSQNKDKFSQIFPANPSQGCRYCNFNFNFNSICEFALIKDI